MLLLRARKASSVGKQIVKDLADRSKDIKYFWTKFQNFDHGCWKASWNVKFKGIKLKNEQN